MKFILSFLLAITLALPFYVFAGGAGPQTDTVQFIQTDFASSQLSAYYDLRNRQSLIQITNTSNFPVSIHVQIFQHDRGCTELNFDDDLTGLDTVIYDLDNIIKNSGNPAPANLADDSYGYVVVTDNALDGVMSEIAPRVLIGNFRIVDEADYEYRSNMLGVSPGNPIPTDLDLVTLQAFFNTADAANQADVVGYVYTNSSTSTVDNFDPGINFDVFIYDMQEEPLSCDRINFACGNVMNYGVNQDYPASRGDNVVCAGGGLANPDGGYISFENGALGAPVADIPVFGYLIGLNNNNGTGSMDTWIDPTLLDTTVIPTSCNEGDECRVFVTSGTEANGDADFFSGDEIGGIAGGDLICQGLADAAALGGTWFVWLGTDSDNPASRFTQATVAYRLIDGTLVANNWADLIDGTIAAGINVDENGTTIPDADRNRAWTGVATDGTSTGANCNNWTGQDGDGLFGNTQATNGEWTNWLERGCNVAGSGGTAEILERRLYCFEQ